MPNMTEWERRVILGGAERKKNYDKHGEGLLWRAFPSPEELAQAAHALGLSLARTLDLMSQRTEVDWFTWEDQEMVVRELIKRQDHTAARISLAVAKEGVADGTPWLDGTSGCKACDENEGICICP